MPAKKLLIITVSLLLVSGLALAGQTIIQKGSIITDVFTAATLTVNRISGHLLKGNINAAGNKVINLADPKNEQDAATKAYVDKFAELVCMDADVPSCSSLGFNPDGTSGEIFACGNQGCAGLDETEKACCKGQVKGTMYGGGSGTSYDWADDSFEGRFGMKEIGCSYSYNYMRAECSTPVVRNFDDPSLLDGECSGSDRKTLWNGLESIGCSVVISKTDHYTISYAARYGSQAAGSGGGVAINGAGSCICKICKLD
jgi:hypothetical protein